MLLAMLNPDAKRANERRETLLPPVTASRTLRLLPNFMNERKLKLLPIATVDVTERLCIEPMRVIPCTLKKLPKRQKLRTLKLLPPDMKSKIDTADPNRANCLTDNELPNVMKSRMDVFPTIISPAL
jgi:hypothetical protein